jgi:thioesterase domain-containing protein/acyl carrier protein
LERVGIRDNFFALGGHSLLAARLFSVILREFGKKFSPAVLFKAPTIEQLALFIDTKESSETLINMVAIRPFGSRPPLFYISPVRDPVLHLRDLCQYLDAELPVYGIESSEQLLNYTLEEAAARVVSLIIDTQPDGPYCLAGYSSGGIIAFEAARQLLQEGREVRFLAMLDTYNPAIKATAHPIMKHPRVSIITRLRCFFMDDGNRMRRLRNKTIKLAGLDSIARFLKIHDPYQEGKSHDPFLDKVIMWLKGYSPGFYPGRLDFFQVEAPHTHWEGCVRTLKVYRLPGIHRDVIHKPQVRIIAGEISAQLKKPTDRDKP